MSRELSRGLFARMDKKLPATSGPKEPAEEDGSSLHESLRVQLEAAIGPLIQGKSREQVVERATAILSKEIFRGPLPHPKHLQAYEDALPGAADRIVGMAERLISVNAETAGKILRADIGYRNLGQIFGFAALVIILGCALWCAVNDNNIGAGLFLATGVLGVVFKFIDGPSFRRNEDGDESED